jgi:hypothetical protein
LSFKKNGDFQRMSKIQIANLAPAGMELLQANESFLTALQDTEAHQVQGGKKNGSKKAKSGQKYNYNNYNYNCYACAPYLPQPVCYVPPAPVCDVPPPCDIIDPCDGGISLIP